MTVMRPFICSSATRWMIFLVAFMNYTSATAIAEDDGDAPIIDWGAPIGTTWNNALDWAKGKVIGTPEDDSESKIGSAFRHFVGKGIDTALEPISDKAQELDSDVKAAALSSCGDQCENAYDTYNFLARFQDKGMKLFERGLKLFDSNANADEEVTSAYMEDADNLMRDTLVEATGHARDFFFRSAAPGSIVRDVIDGVEEAEDAAGAIKDRFLSAKEDLEILTPALDKFGDKAAEFRAYVQGEFNDVISSVTNEDHPGDTNSGINGLQDRTTTGRHDTLTNSQPPIDLDASATTLEWPQRGTSSGVDAAKDNDNILDTRDSTWPADTDVGGGAEMRASASASDSGGDEWPGGLARQAGGAGDTTATQSTTEEWPNDSVVRGLDTNWPEGQQTSQSADEASNSNSKEGLDQLTRNSEDIDNRTTFALNEEWKPEFRHDVDLGSDVLEVCVTRLRSRADSSGSYIEHDCGDDARISLDPPKQLERSTSSEQLSGTQGPSSVDTPRSAQPLSQQAYNSPGGGYSREPSMEPDLATPGGFTADPEHDAYYDDDNQNANRVDCGDDLSYLASQMRTAESRTDLAQSASDMLNAAGGASASIPLLLQQISETQKWISEVRANREAYGVDLAEIDHILDMGEDIVTLSNALLDAAYCIERNGG